MSARQSGLLLHISSLPGEFGVGDFGPEAYRFIDILSASQQSVWQILPLTPTDGINGYSPYSSASAFAGNYHFISPQLLLDDKLLTQEDLNDVPDFPNDYVDFDAVCAFKKRLLDSAFKRFWEHSFSQKNFNAFVKEQSFWLNDFALFTVIKERLCQDTWARWPEDLKRRKPAALGKLEQDYAGEMLKVKFVQYLFFKQWAALKKYGRSKRIQIMGDIPFYVSYDSVDVWCNPGLFKLDKAFAPKVVAGVPPDYFSSTGQRWGNPVYNWKRLEENKFAWWIKRFEHNFFLYDILRVDHFRAFINYWEIPAGEDTAINGRWRKTPTKKLFEALNFQASALPTGRASIVAEDLGMIAPNVGRAIKRLGFPGMKILMFAFGDDLNNGYLPHNYSENCVVYTGTHDNNTVRGWYANEATDKEKKNVKEYVTEPVSEGNVHLAFIRLALKSKAALAIFPVQDVLGLGHQARMNTPGTGENNWKWRLLPDALSAQKLNQIPLSRC